MRGRRRKLIFFFFLPLPFFFSFFSLPFFFFFSFSFSFSFSFHFSLSHHFPLSLSLSFSLSLSHHFSLSLSLSLSLSRHFLSLSFRRKFLIINPQHLDQKTGIISQLLLPHFFQKEMERKSSQQRDNTSNKNGQFRLQFSFCCLGVCWEFEMFLNCTKGPSLK